MLMISPIYPTVPQELREPLAMTTPPPTLNKVPRLQREQSPGRRKNSNKQQRITSLMTSSPLPAGSTFAHLHYFWPAPPVTVTPHLFGLHGPTPKLVPKAVARWKIG